jgi:hypothetical protein
MPWTRCHGVTGGRSLLKRVQIFDVAEHPLREERPGLTVLSCTPSGPNWADHALVRRTAAALLEPWSAAPAIAYADRVDLSATTIGQRLYEEVAFVLTSSARLKLVL